jgi:hypothetical protein
MGKFAEGTEVTVERSRAEIEGILARYGADQFMYGWQEKGAVLAFRASERFVRFTLPLPDRNSKEFTHGRTARSGSASILLPPSEQAARFEQGCRRSWRALALCIKAKLESVASGISHFEDEFMANIVLPNGQTMSEHARPLIKEAYQSGTMPALLPHLP